MPSTSPSTTSILRATQQCIQFFRRGLPRLRRGMLSPLDLGSQAILENQMGRFKIWAGNIGVFAAGNASTDYRLRQDQDVRDIMIQMLARLKRNLEQLLNLSTLQEEGLPEDNGSDSSTSSSPSLVLSSDSDSSAGGTSEAQQKQDPWRDRLNAINDIITNLYRLSAIIRKPMSIDEVMKVNNFITKNQDSSDTKDFESHIQWQTRFRHPGASATLIDRLVNTIIFRRNKLLYRERHHEKLRQGVDQAFGLKIEAPDRSYPWTMNQNDSSKNPQGKSRFLTAPAPVKSSFQTIPYSATEASLINRLGFSSNPKSIAVSGMTKSAVTRREQLDVPPPPRLATEGEEIVCPYCFEVLEQEKIKHAQWTRQVLKDIDPYICLFQDCHQPNEHFRNVEDWMNHMKWQHTIIWSCQACSHKSTTVFDSKIEFEQHMNQEHHHTFTQSQLPMLVQKSAHPASDTFSVLTAQNNGAASGSHYECPLCDFTVEKANDQNRPDSTLLGAELPVNEAPKIIQNHIAAHLESIALLSLPEQDENFSIARESDLTRDRTRKDDNQEEEAAEEDFLPGDLEAEDAQRDPLKIFHIPFPDEVVGPPASDPKTTEDTWNLIFENLHLRGTDDFNPAQDVNLRGFVERARNIQMIKSWKYSETPVLLVHDPDGMEIGLYIS